MNPMRDTQSMITFWWIIFSSYRFMYRILFCRVCRDDLDIMFHSPPNATWHPEVELVVVLLARDTNLSRRGTCPNGRDLLAALLLLSFIRSLAVIQTSNMLDFALPIKASLLDSVFSSCGANSTQSPGGFCHRQITERSTRVKSVAFVMLCSFPGAKGPSRLVFITLPKPHGLMVSILLSIGRCWNQLTKPGICNPCSSWKTPDCLVAPISNLKRATKKSSIPFHIEPKQTEFHSLKCIALQSGCMDHCHCRCCRCCHFSCMLWQHVAPDARSTLNILSWHIAQDLHPTLSSHSPQLWSGTSMQCLCATLTLLDRLFQNRWSTWSRDLCMKKAKCLTSIQVVGLQ